METITIAAIEVKSGDTVESIGEVFAAASVFGETIIMGKYGNIKTKNERPVTVSRPLPDPCPRGRMTVKNGNPLVNDSLILPGTWCGKEVWRRIIALWNEAEREPYRTTAEIEAGLEQH